MSVETKLYISSKWELQDIKTAIEEHLGYSVCVRNCTNISPDMFEFILNKEGKKSREITLFVNNWTAIGSTTQLRLGADKEGKEILKSIAEIFGGIYQANDNEENYEMIGGLFYPSDGLSYFLKYALLHNEMNDADDLKGLNKSIAKWQDRLKHHSIDVFKEE